MEARSDGFVGAEEALFFWSVVFEGILSYSSLLGSAAARQGVYR